MMADYIYEYWKTAPEYAPNKFDIVNGLEGSATGGFAEYGARVGGAMVGGTIVGGVDERDLLDIEIDDDNVAIVFGNFEDESWDGGSDRAAGGRHGASTLEDGMRELFSDTARPPRSRRGRAEPPPLVDNIYDADESTSIAEYIGRADDPDAADHVLDACPDDTSSCRTVAAAPDSDSDDEASDEAAEPFRDGAASHDAALLDAAAAVDDYDLASGLDADRVTHRRGGGDFSIASFMI